MNKSPIKARLKLRKLLKLYRLETGYSMLEAVVVVGVLLALAVSGFFAYGPITENAKIAKVKSAASEIHTGVLVASIDGDSKTKPEDVIANWNASTDKIKVGILAPAPGGTSANGDYCVEAWNTESSYIRARQGSCADAPAGASSDTDGDGTPDSIDPDIDGDGIPNADDPTPNGDNPGGNTGGNTGGNNGGNTGGPVLTPIDYSFSGKLAAWGSGEESLLANGFYMWMNYPGSNTPYVGPKTKYLAPTNILDNKTVTAFDVSYDHACAVADGVTYCWGANRYGQLGRGTVDPDWWVMRGIPAPVVMPGELAGKSFSKLALSDAGVSCGLYNSSAYCWGNNEYGQIGIDSTDEYILSPTKITGALAGKTVTDIETKGWGESVCAIADGDVYCWGNNDSGQLGIGSFDNSSVPVKVGGVLEGKKATRLAMSIDYGSVCAIADGKAFCWGSNWYGQLGAGMTPPGAVDTDYVPQPVAVNTDTFPTNAVVTDIALGYNQTCAVVSGKAYCWGNNDNNFKDYGQLGRGDALMGESPLPKPVVTAGSPMDGKTVTHIGAADSTSYAVADGKLYGWGGDWTGQIIASSTDHYIPVLIDRGDISGKTIKDILPTWDTVFAIYAD